MASQDKPALRWEHWTAAGLLAAMALIAFANVISRYVLHASLSFTEEITIHLFVLLTVVGSGLAFERGSHLGMVTLYGRFPSAVKKSVTLLSAVLAALLFAVVDLLLIRTIYFEITLFKARSPALDIPVWVYYALVPPCSVTVFRGILRGTVDRVKALDPEPPSGEET
jgi:TRAP-type C4-dicarboxylate transport system permease small subunit